MEYIKLLEVSKGLNKLINDTQIIDTLKEPRDTENEWQEFFSRFTSMQGWFLRCSWFTKINFLKELAQLISNLNIIVQILYTLYSALGKDRVYVEAQGLFFLPTDKIIIDDNRCLENLTLARIMRNTYHWFSNLSECQQYLTITGLVKLGDNSVAGKVFKEYTIILKKRLPPLIIEAPVAKAPKAKKEKKDKKEKKQKGKGKKDKGKEIQVVEKIVIEKSDYEIFVESLECHEVKDNETEMLKIKWTNFIKSYKKQLGIKEPEIEGQKKEKKKKEKKQKISKDLPDQIQLLPIWINKSLIANFEANKLKHLKKINKYWGFMIRELRKDVKCSQGIYKNKIKLQKKIGDIKFKQQSTDKMFIKCRESHVYFQKILQMIELDSQSLFTDCLKEMYEDVPVTVFPRYVNV